MQIGERKFIVTSIQLDRYSLQSEVLLNPLATHILAMTGLLESSEGQCHIAQAVSINPDRTGIYLSGYAKGFVQVSSVYARSQAKSRVCSEFNGFLFVIESLH